MRSVIVFIVFILISCGEKVIEPPENLIDEEQMSLILYDIAILNTTKGTNPAILKKNNIKLMPFIFEKYKIDSLQFAQSDLYYASIPLKYQEIYETVEERLEAEVNTIKKEEQRKRGSTKKANEARKDSLNAMKKTRLNDSLSKK